MPRNMGNPLHTRWNPSRIVWSFVLLQSWYFVSAETTKKRASVAMTSAHIST
jgi:hypothetical protein